MCEILNRDSQETGRATQQNKKSPKLCGKPTSRIQTFRFASNAARTVAALHDPFVGTRAFATVVLLSPVLSFIAFRVEMVDCLLI